MNAAECGLQRPSGGGPFTPQLLRAVHFSSTHCLCSSSIHGPFSSTEILCLKFEHENEN